MAIKKKGVHESSKAESSNENTSEKKKASAGKKTLIVVVVILAVILALLGVVYAVFHHYYSLLDNVDDLDPNDKYWEDPDDPIGDDPTPDDPGTSDDDPDNPNTPPSSNEDIKDIEDQILENLEKQEANSELYKTDAFNIMILGVDSRKDSFSGRSDAMILLSINKTTKKVVMCSFLRDIYCSIPGKSSNRLNTAYGFGGIDLHKKAMKANFGITVDKCVVVNFYLVMDAVNAVDGIDLDLTSAEIKVMNRYIREHNKLLGENTETDVMPQTDGTYHLNGKQALAYARVRYVGSDFARTNRQRTVILKCLEKIKSKSVSEIMDLAEKFLPKVRTDLSESDCASLLMTLISISDYEIESMAVPVKGSYKGVTLKNGAQVLSIDFDKNSKAWHDAVEGK